MSLIVLKKIIEMFIILLVGVIIYKAKIINDVSTKHLSNVLLLLVSPLLIIQSLSLIHISEPTRQRHTSRMPSSA